MKSVIKNVIMSVCMPALLVVGCVQGSIQSKRLMRYSPDTADRSPWLWSEEDDQPISSQPVDRVGRKVGAFARGDKIMIYLREIPEEKVIPCVIDAIGNISLPHIGTVKLEGRTTFEAEKLIRQAYIAGQYYMRINVVIVPQDGKYFVHGEVKRPGPFTLSGDLTLMQAIAAAGGFTEYANERKVRVGNMTYDTKRIKQGKQSDPIIKTDDIIEVPATIIL
ncbi:MAG: SLBB domain-containing protein [Lentisphaerae bacterium]|nr:SLBB domain-containing protein [Lentisphaerota bacterium]